MLQGEDQPTKPTLEMRADGRIGRHRHADLGAEAWILLRPVLTIPDAQPAPAPPMRRKPTDPVLQRVVCAKVLPELLARFRHRTRA